MLTSTVEIVPVNSGCFCYSLGESKVKTAVKLYEDSVYVMSLGQLFNAILCVKANRYTLCEHGDPPTRNEKKEVTNISINHFKVK